MKIFARQHVTCAKVITTKKITGDYLSLAKEEVLVTMARLLYACCDNYWDTHCNIIRKSNELKGYSGFIAYHMIYVYLFVRKDLKRIKNNYMSEEIF